MKRKKSSGGLIVKMRTEKNKLANTRAARLAFLVKWSSAQARSDGRSLHERRAAFERTRRSRSLNAAPCWVCARVTQLVRHHVIQLQHGGSNWHLNIFAICDGCHAEIHPWLKTFDHPVVSETREWDLWRP